MWALLLGGLPVDPARDVRITGNSLLAEGGDGVAMLRQGRQRIGGMLDLDSLVAHLLANNPSPDLTPRIRWVD